MRIVCPKCGTEIPNVETPCPKCGFTSEDFQRQVRHEQFLEKQKKGTKGDLAGKAFLFLLVILLIPTAIIKLTSKENAYFPPQKVEKTSGPEYSLAPVMIARINKGFADLGWGQSPKATKKLRLKKSDVPASKYEPISYTFQDSVRILDIDAPYQYDTPPLLWFYRNKLISIQAFYTDTESVYKCLCQTFSYPTYTKTTPFPPGVNFWDEEKVQIRFFPTKIGCFIQINHKALIQSLNDERRKHHLEELL